MIKWLILLAVADNYNYNQKQFMCKWQIGILSGEDFFTSLLKISVLNNATHAKIFIWINLKVTKIDYFLNLYEWDTKEQIVKNDI